jgi:hypothetical protein
VWRWNENLCSGKAEDSRRNVAIAATTGEQTAAVRSVANAAVARELAAELTVPGEKTKDKIHHRGTENTERKDKTFNHRP